MKNVLVRLAVIASLAVPFSAHASKITGSESIALIGVTVTPTGAPLSPITGVNNLAYSFALTSGAGLGDFGAIPVGTTISASALFPNGVNGGNGVTPFSFNILGYGTFTETTNPIIVNSAAGPGTSSVTILLDGTFTPSGALAGFDPNDAAFNISFTQTGGSYSGSATFAVPPTSPVPEPSSIMLLGTAVLSGAGLMKKRLLS